MALLTLSVDTLTTINTTDTINPAGHTGPVLSLCIVGKTVWSGSEGQYCMERVSTVLHTIDTILNLASDATVRLWGSEVDTPLRTLKQVN